MIKSIKMKSIHSISLIIESIKKDLLENRYVDLYLGTEVYFLLGLRIPNAISHQELRRDCETIIELSAVSDGSVTDRSMRLMISRMIKRIRFNAIHTAFRPIVTDGFTLAGLCRTRLIFGEHNDCSRIFYDVFDWIIRENGLISYICFSNASCSTDISFVINASKSIEGRNSTGRHQRILIQITSSVYVAIDCYLQYPLRTLRPEPKCVYNIHNDMSVSFYGKLFNWPKSWAQYFRYVEEIIRCHAPKNTTFINNVLPQIYAETRPKKIKQLFEPVLEKALICDPIVKSILEYIKTKFEDTEIEKNIDTIIGECLIVKRIVYIRNMMIFLKSFDVNNYQHFPYELLSYIWSFVIV
jgi:hypothetical protein